ncbi:MAG: hypothetical protein ACJ77X_05135, partial [Chloroflexota bacterium]
MRLPWPFGRGTTSGASDSEPPDAQGAAALPSPSTTAASRDAAPTGAWASLPPIQRTVGPAPVVAPSAPFLRDVPGHRPLPPIVQPLGHESAPSAPAGLVVAHATTVPALTSQASMPTRHVQRRATTPAPESPWSPPDEAPEAVSGAAGTPVEPEAAPVRTLAPVAASQTVSPAVRPLTVAPPIEAPRAPVAQRA